MVNWKKIGMGVAAATIGAATFGAIHFMFLAPQYGVGDFMGIPLGVLLPILLGTLGFVGTYAVGRKWGDTLKNVMTFGSAAAIGFGVAQYAGWITPAVTARARVATTRFPIVRRSYPVARTQAVVSGTKLI